MEIELKIGQGFISGDGFYRIVKIENDKVIAIDEGHKFKEFDINNFKRVEDMTEEEISRLD